MCPSITTTALSSGPLCAHVPPTRHRHTQQSCLMRAAPRRSRFAARRRRVGLAHATPRLAPSTVPTPRPSVVVTSSTGRAACELHLVRVDLLRCTPPLDREVQRVDTAPRTTHTPRRAAAAHSVKRMLLLPRQRARCVVKGSRSADWPLEHSTTNASQWSNRVHAELSSAAIGRVA